MMGPSFAPLLSDVDIKMLQAAMQLTLALLSHLLCPSDCCSLVRAKDDSVGGSAFAPYNRAAHGDDRFLCLLSVATNEEQGFELNANASDNNAKENPSPPLPNRFSPVTTFGGNNLEVGCNPTSDMSEEQLFDLFTSGGEFELCSNGFGQSMTSEE